jgi:DNA polymerase III subunit epsilon
MKELKKMAAGYNTEKQADQIEKRYPMDKPQGVHAALRDIHQLNIEKYQNLALVDFLVDLERAIKNAGLTKTEKQVLFYFYMKQLSVYEIELKTGLSKGKIHRDIKMAVRKISKNLDNKEMTYMGEKTYVVFDLETTGLDYKTDQVIEISAVKLNKELKEIANFQTYVMLNEGNELKPEITRLTGISEKDLKSGMLEQLALQVLDGFIGDSVVVGHNVQFDLGFLSRYTKHIPVEKFICTRAMALLLDSAQSARLCDLVNKYNIAHGKLHRATNDVKAEVKLFKLLRKELKDRGYHEKDYTNLVINSPDRPVFYIPNEHTKIVSKQELRKAN